jgi:hypothetical protein
MARSIAEQEVQARIEISCLGVLEIKTASAAFVSVKLAEFMLRLEGALSCRSSEKRDEGFGKVR